VALIKIDEFLKLVPVVRQTPGRYLWSSYDQETDTLYINFKKPSHATDSELTDDDVIVRYEGQEIVGITIPHASQRDGEASGEWRRVGEVGRPSARWPRASLIRVRTLLRAIPAGIRRGPAVVRVRRGSGRRRLFPNGEGQART
jgi:uncharacterized protein YuzE